MKKIAFTALASAAYLALAACGGSETPTDASTESVEPMADESMAADPMATDGATDAASEAAM